MYVVLLFDDVYAIFNKLYDKKKQKTTEICQRYNIFLLLSSLRLNFLATNSIKTLMNMLINCLDLTAPLFTRCWHSVNGHKVCVLIMCECGCLGVCVLPLVVSSVL